VNLRIARKVMLNRWFRSYPARTLKQAYARAGSTICAACGHGAGKHGEGQCGFVLGLGGLWFAVCSCEGMRWKGTDGQG